MHGADARTVCHAGQYRPPAGLPTFHVEHEKRGRSGATRWRSGTGPPDEGSTCAAPTRGVGVPRGTSEQGALRRDAGAAGVAVRAGGRLAQELDVSAADVPALGRLQAHLGEGSRRPAVVAGRGLAHRQPAADPQERGGALRNNGGRAEGAGDDEVERRPQLGVAPGLLGPGLADLDPVAEVEGGDRRDEGVAAAGAGVDQQPAGSGPPAGENQPGDAGAAAEVEAPGRARVADGAGERRGVLEVVLNRGGPEETERLRPPEDGEEGLVQVRRPRRARSRPAGGAPRPRTSWPRRRSC